jgi:hypothetical protein
MKWVIPSAVLLSNEAKIYIYFSNETKYALAQNIISRACIYVKKRTVNTNRKSFCTKTSNFVLPIISQSLLHVVTTLLLNEIHRSTSYQNDQQISLHKE